MRLSEVKTGQRCFCYDGYYHYKPDSPYEERKVTVEGIQRADRDKGIGYSRVQCRKETTGELFLIDAYFLTPLEDHHKEMQMAKLEAEENQANAEIILQAAGTGSQIDGKVSRRQARLKFTEEAAERLLKACGAKPLPDNRRPGKHTRSADYHWLSTLLSRRVCRALGGGYAPEWIGRELHEQGGDYEACVTLKSEELGKAAAKLNGKQVEIDSPLGELLS